MYQSHPNLIEPPEDTRLWRYMDFAKFLALLETSSLHLAALTSFDDPFEGHPPKSVIDAITTQPMGLSPEEMQNHKAMVAHNLSTFQQTRNFVYASCWHMNRNESAGMWSQYLRSGDGIAIQTTFSKLKAAIANEPLPIQGGVVQYVDFDTFEPEDFNALVWAALKRQGFEHECEFRLLGIAAGTNPLGFPIQADPRTLIECVYVAPTTPDWVLNLVDAILKRYGYPIVPVRSDLAEGPKYFSVPAWVNGG